MKNKVPTSNPHPAVIAAEAALDERGVRYSRHGDYQLMLGRLSYYPSKGTIVICGKEREPIRGQSLDDAIAMAKELFPGNFRVMRLPKTL